MVNAFIRTKIYTPGRRPDIISRDRLLRLLDEQLENKLILINAPPGYGKTTLLIDWASRIDLPVCWYTLDHRDRDLLRFSTHLIESIKTKFPQFGEVSTAVLNSLSKGETSTDQLVTAFVNDVFENIGEHFVIVLDDFHSLEDHVEINKLIDQLIQDLSENVHIILVTRRLPQLNGLVVMVAHTQVGGFDLAELAFTESETRRLLSARSETEIPDETIKKLHEMTDGWVTGLVLTSGKFLSGGTDKASIDQLMGVDLPRYFNEQVLSIQPSGLQEFLLRTSVFDEFDSELCQTVFGDQTDWQKCIHDAIDRNLFVFQIGNEGWVSYHGLFRDFLRAEHTKQYPDESGKVLKRLSEHYIKLDEWERAYDVLVQMDDVNALADLIEQAGEPMVKAGNIETLSNWLNSIPEDIYNLRPGLLARKGIVTSVQGDLPKSLEIFKFTEAIYRVEGNISKLCGCLLWKTFANFNLGNYDSVSRDIEEILTLITDVDEYQDILAEAYRYKGLMLAHTGNQKQGFDYLLKSLSIYEAIHDKNNITNLCIDLGSILCLQGQYHEATKYNLKALKHLDRIHNVISSSIVANDLAILYQLQGDYEKAGQYITKAVNHANKLNNNRLKAFTYSSLGDLLIELFDVDFAMEYYRKAKDSSVKSGQRFIEFYVDLVEIMHATYPNQLKKAMSTLESVKKRFVNNVSEYEKGLILFAEGHYRYHLDDFQSAIECFNGASKYFTTGKHRLEQLKVSYLIAHCFYMLGDYKLATDQFAKTIKLARFLDSYHPLVVLLSDDVKFLQAMQNNASQNKTIINQIPNLMNLVDIHKNKTPSIRNRVLSQVHPYSDHLATIKVFSLGGMTVKIGNKPVTSKEWTQQRSVRELFFLLITYPKGLSRDEILNNLWREKSAEQSNSSFKNTLYRLRFSLGRSVIQTDGKRYFFNRELPYKYDVEDFEAQVKKGNSSLKTEEKISAFQIAVDIYKGIFLPEVASTWVEDERQRLAKLFISSALALAELYFLEGEFDMAILLCQKIHIIDPCEEQAYQLAMKIYSTQENKVALAREFQDCMNILRSELDIEPSKYTQSLFQDLIKVQ